jgi:hypothetical protein
VPGGFALFCGERDISLQNSAKLWLGESMKTYKADIIFAAVALGLGLVLLLVLMTSRKTGTEVQVRVAGQVVQSFSLGENTTYLIEGTGGGQNRLVIQDGAAWIEEADCPDALCVGMGHIERIGQSVVCLPHQVVVEIIGEAVEADIDIVAG